MSVSSQGSNRLRIAAVSYLNAVPLIWGLKHGPKRGDFQVDYMLPSACADALRNGTAQASIIPSIEYQRIPGLRVVPGLCIASSGPVRSVLLLAKRPVPEIRSVALDTSSRTSSCLVQIVLRKHFGISPRFVPRNPDLPTMLEECDAALLIGDPALAMDFQGLDVYDLAELWKAMTGKPFVFAFWAVRQEAASEQVVKAFQESARFAFEHFDEMVAEESVNTGLPAGLVREYLTKNIDFELGEKNLDGLRLFYALAKELSLIEQARPLDMVGESSLTEHR